VRRYEVSWAGFFAVLPRGRDATLADITKGFVLEYRRSRARAVGGRKRLERPGQSVSAGTMNRDLAALGAFLTWVRDVEGLAPLLRPQRFRLRPFRGAR